MIPRAGISCLKLVEYGNVYLGDTVQDKWNSEATQNVIIGLRSIMTVKGDRQLRHDSNADQPQLQLCNGFVAEISKNSYDIKTFESNVLQKIVSHSPCLSHSLVKYIYKTTLIFY